jgi:aspartate carbamoyltransferase catalytic subunit
METAILKNGRLNEEQKAKWLKGMDNVYMSSEESGGEDTIIVHPLPWRTKYVTSSSTSSYSSS